MEMTEYPIAWVTLNKYLSLTGDKGPAVAARRSDGKWVEGHHVKEFDGNVWVNLPAVEHWISAQGARSSLPAAGPRSLPHGPTELHSDVIEQLTQAIANGVTRAQAPQLAIQVDAWDVLHIARYMKRSADTVRREVVVQPSFPKPMRIPGAGRAHALYKAREVVAWLERFSK